MTSTGSGKKAAVATEKRRLRNRSVRSSVKTYIAKAEISIGAREEAAHAKTAVAISSVDKAIRKGVIHKKKGARIKSRLMKKVNTVTVSETEQSQTSEE